jgi:hypothetical protein
MCELTLDVERTVTMETVELEVLDVLLVEVLVTETVILQCISFMVYNKFEDVH